MIDSTKFMETAAWLMEMMEDAEIDPKVGIGSLVVATVMLAGDDALAIKMIQAATLDLDKALGDEWRHRPPKVKKELLN